MVAEEQQLNPGNKQKRADLDRKTKWQTDEVRKDLVEKLTVTATQIFGDEFVKKLFSSDFNLHV